MKNARRKILFVVQDLEMGGAEQLKFTIEKYIDKTRYDTIYCCIRNTGMIGEEIMRRGGNVIPLNTIDNFYNLIATWKLYNLAKKLKPDIIHSMLFNANFHARIVGMLLHIPVIIEEHGLYIWKKRYHISIDRILAKHTTRVIAVSRSVKEFLMKQENLDPDKVTVLYDCVDLNLLKTATTREEARRRLAMHEKTFVIGTVGNLREEKGHRILLHALKQVLVEYGDVRLFIVGDGPLYDYLLEQVMRMGLAKNVVFLKKRSDIADFLKALDLFVLPSTSEGLGIALIEAIAVGLRCIASNVGGIAEIAKGAKDVLLVRPNNPHELSRAIIKEIERKRPGREEAEMAVGRVSIKDIFTPRVYLNQLENIYNATLAKV
jgi:glycosyltransferase involved in cell wall biosynthesis